MITNMQIVNHIRDDGWQIHAIFNMGGWDDLPCQLVSRGGDEYRVKGMWMPDEDGVCGVTDLNERFVEAASAAYDKAMTEIFGDDWRKIEDGRTRVMEWRSREVTSGLGCGRSLRTLPIWST
jgi:hypothetical protein